MGDECRRRGMAAVSARCLREKRIVVVGTRGVGKSTFAREMSHRLALPCVQLDAPCWERNWTMAAPEVFRRRAAEATTEDSWVVDGEYDTVRDIIWHRATHLVWLDYPFLLNAYRHFSRTARRILTQEELWNGNRQRLQPLSRNSFFLWLIRGYWRRRNELQRLFQSHDYAHLQKVRLRSPESARQWLAERVETDGQRAR